MANETPHHFHLADYGPVLGTRQRGGEVAAHLRSLAGGDDRDAVLDFAAVEVLSPIFAQELLAAVTDLLARSQGRRLVIASNLNEDVGDALLLVLERRGGTLAYQRGDEVELLADRPHLQETLREAQRLGEFTVQRLSESLGVKNAAVSQRLKALQAAGAVARERDPSAAHGTRHLYRAATTKLVVAAD